MVSNLLFYYHNFSFSWGYFSFMCRVLRMNDIISTCIFLFLPQMTFFLSLPWFCTLVTPPYFDRRKLAGYPKEILLLEQLCWRGQSTGGGSLKYTTTVKWKTRAWAVFGQYLSKNSLPFDCIFRAFFTKKTAKIAQEVWNLFQNFQKSFRKLRGRYWRRLETSGSVKMMKSAKNRQTAPPGA